ncbi:solute carrier family 31 (copper transporters) member 1 [Nannochloropsis gaditana CCMP526]|nr:solute carrier family 31 (copper transporters) member 1 [Nannochloropsis gaditana CCMP526]EKU21081.1 solute carrier family 31 (copper transporters) member 1 [Nannochloropsis gaditana CCMP526]|eukprot:XP_005855280.1 solute carrier family 31 (copper transporters) member 1 [Nannochloropsis gaditana CCMP526]
MRRYSPAYYLSHGQLFVLGSICRGKHGHQGRTAKMDMDMPGMDMDMPGMDMGGMGDSGGFCQGEGSVMNNGFVFMPQDGYCILYLFQGAVVNTAGKYAGALIGTFFLAFSVEALRHFRLWMRLRRATVVLAHGEKEGEVVTGPPLRAQVLPIFLEALLFGVHMFVAYLIMLLVMLYEWAIFISLLLGLAAGYFTFEMWEAYRVANKKQLPSAIGAIGGGCGCVDEVIHVAAESTIHPGHGGQRNGNGTQNSGDKV